MEKWRSHDHPVFLEVSSAQPACYRPQMSGMGKRNAFRPAGRSGGIEDHRRFARFRHDRCELARVEKSRPAIGRSRVRVELYDWQVGWNGRKPFMIGKGKPRA